MTRLARREAKTTGQAAIKINGELVNLYFAKQVYRCAACLSGLDYRGAGLVCSANPKHTGFIHQRDAEAITARQEENINELSEVYQVVDGKVVIKCQSSE